MKRAIRIAGLGLLGVVAAASLAVAQDPCNACGRAKRPARRWMTVWETREMEVPEKVMIDVEVERPARTIRKAQSMVEIPTFRELKTTVQSTKKRVVYTEEEYDDFQSVVRTIDVPTQKCVVTRVPVVKEMNVCREQYKWVEREGRRVRVPEIVFDKVKLTSYKEERELVDATVRKNIEEKVPVRSVRRVAHTVEEPTNKVVKRWVPVKEKRVMTRWEPETSYKKVVEQRCQVRMVKKPITFRKRVEVPAGYARCPGGCDKDALDEAAAAWFAEREKQAKAAPGDDRERLARIRAALDAGLMDEAYTGVDQATLAKMLEDENFVDELYAEDEPPAADVERQLDEFMDELADNQDA